MTTTPIREVDGPANWLAADLEAKHVWCRELTSDELDELDAALRHAKERNPALDLASLRVDDFPLPTFTAEIDNLRRVLVDGCGVFAYTGVPVDRYDDDELRALWWGLCSSIGTPVSQSWRGDVIGDVRDIGTGVTGRAGRGYTSNAELSFHCDTADVTGLFFLRQGKSGGVSRIASSVAVHNVIARRRPDLLDLLYRPMPVSWQSNEVPGTQQWYDMPVFGRVGDDVACAYVRTNILWAAANCGAPPLTEQQIEAVEHVAAVAAEPQMWVERRFEAGTMWFVNNQTIFHMRTEFTDHDDPALKRHLLRVWLSLPNSRRLPASFASYFGEVSAGAVRGGYPSRSPTPVFHTA